jgi:hypothetical protein
MFICINSAAKIGDDEKKNMLGMRSIFFKKRHFFRCTLICFLTLRKHGTHSMFILFGITGKTLCLFRRFVPLFGRTEPAPSGGEWRRRLEPAPSWGGRRHFDAPPLVRHCEERSDVAIQDTVPCALDCHVASLLAMTGEGATKAGDCALHETCNPDGVVGEGGAFFY